MSQQPPEPDIFYIAPAHSDSSGRSAVPGNALFVGSRAAVMERILDSKARKTALSLINDADRVRKAKAELKADVAAFEADRASFATDVQAVREVLLNEFVGKLDALAARMDALEAERAHDPDDDELPSPPGSADDGHLQSPIEAPIAEDQKDAPAHV